MKSSTLKVKTIELFAGVGGFRVGLNKIKKINPNEHAEENGNFDFVYFNQWEPNSKLQSAYNCYKVRFPNEIDSTSNIDISLVDKNIIPNHDLLVAGFPCQDYSVARTLSNEQGIQGKKGVLWWEIYSTIKKKNTNFLLLENVDRLLISPSKQRGRDFLIILKCLSELNYIVEWRIINAADYGMPQKRKRIFIFAYKKNCKFCKEFFQIMKEEKINSIQNYLFSSSLFGNNFPIEEILDTNISNKKLLNDISYISENCEEIFFDSGIMFNNNIYTFKTKPKKEKECKLSKLLLKTEEVLPECFINDINLLNKLKYFKDSKRLTRVKNGFEYKYTEGKMVFPDDINKPGRTMLTSEGTPNRSSHVIMVNNKYRYLDPKECELLNMFPKNWTNVNNISTRNRRFLMGNSLVCGILERLSDSLFEIIRKEWNDD